MIYMDNSYNYAPEDILHILVVLSCRVYSFIIMTDLLSTKSHGLHSHIQNVPAMNDLHLFPRSTQEGGVVGLKPGDAWYRLNEAARRLIGGIHVTFFMRVGTLFSCELAHFCWYHTLGIHTYVHFHSYSNVIYAQMPSHGHVPTASYAATVSKRIVYLWLFKILSSPAGIQYLHLFILVLRFGAYI